MKLYRTRRGPVVEVDPQTVVAVDADWDAMFRRDDLGVWLADRVAGGTPLDAPLDDHAIEAPIASQEVWAAGVTYFRSRSARMEESRQAADFYDLVYDADRPELFFKATPHRVVGTGGAVRIRADAKWNVPEPELTACVSAGGEIFGYTIGNDMSSRDLEGENPLYLPQAKVYDQCCGLGPGILLAPKPLPASIGISMEIERAGTVVFEGTTDLAQMKRKPAELVEYLFRDNSFPNGCFLLTGTGIVPSSEFTLDAGDQIRITIESIGTLVNRVA